MKKTLAIILTSLLLFAACSAEPDDTPPPSADTPKTENAPAAEEPTAEAEAGNQEKFEGVYIQEDADPESTYMEAVITENTITINWKMDSGETTALYWAGTFEQPTGAEEYTFDSVNDKEQTQYALLASGDDTKPMTVKDGKISFAVTMMGVTTTVCMIPAEETP